MPITVATKDSISTLVSLLNSAYRGEESKKGWTTEADLLLGELRTDATTLNILMDTPGAFFLQYKEDNELLGCVFYKKKINDYTWACLVFRQQRKRKESAKN